MDFIGCIYGFGFAMGQRRISLGSSSIELPAEVVPIHAPQAECGRGFALVLGGKKGDWARTTPALRQVRSVGTKSFRT